MSSSSGHNKAIGHSTSVTYDIFVGNLPADANEKNVGRLFSKFGEIQSISVRDNNSTPGTKISSQQVPSATSPRPRSVIHLLKPARNVTHCFPLSLFPLSLFPLSLFPLSLFPLSLFPLSLFPLSLFPLSLFPLSLFPLSLFPSIFYLICHPPLSPSLPTTLLCPLLFPPPSSVPFSSHHPPLSLLFHHPPPLSLLFPPPSSVPFSSHHPSCVPSLPTTLLSVPFSSHHPPLSPSLPTTLLCPLLFPPPSSVPFSLKNNTTAIEVLLLISSWKLDFLFSLSHRYVRYYCDEDSKKAVEECNGCEVDGNRIIVKKTGKNDKRQRLPGDKSQSTGNKAVDKRMDKMNNRGPDIVPFEDRPNRHGGNNKQDGKSSRSSQSSLEDSGDETVLVSYVENCNVLWVQVVNEDVQERLLFVSNQLAEICPSAKMADNFQLIKIYAAKFSEDQLWYRCIIREQLGSNRVRVLFVDYGNEEEMAAANVVEVPQSLCEFKPFARKVILHLTKSKKFNDEKGVAFVKEFTNGKLLRLRPSVRLTDGTGIYGELFYEGMNLTDLFVQEGYIVKKILHQKNNQTIPVPSPLLTLSCSQPPLSSSTSSSLSTSNMASLNAGPLPAPCSNMDQLINMNKAVISHDRREMTSTSPSWGSVENMSLIQLRSELTSVKQELVQTRQENNVLSVELANTRTKLKNLQVEYNNKLAEESPHALLKKINSLIEKVKKLRSQFPSNGEGSSSTLAKAIELATSCDRMHTLSPGSLNTVNSLISVFNTLQKEILSTDKDQPPHTLSVSLSYSLSLASPSYSLCLSRPHTLSLCLLPHTLSVCLSKLPSPLCLSQDSLILSLSVPRLLSLCLSPSYSLCLSHSPHSLSVCRDSLIPLSVCRKHSLSCLSPSLAYSLCLSPRHPLLSVCRKTPSSLSVCRKTLILSLSVAHSLILSLSVAHSLILSLCLSPRLHTLSVCRLPHTLSVCRLPHLSVCRALPHTLSVAPSYSLCLSRTPSYSLCLSRTPSYSLCLSRTPSYSLSLSLKSELDELIETRDTTRLKLYENLSACLADLSNIPLEDKLNQMQDVVNTLGMEYKNFLHFSIHSVPPLADLLPAYTEWKRKKEIEFQKVRTETDSSRKGLSKSLLLIDEQMKLTCSLAPSEEIPDLQYWLKQFTQVLQQEIAVTDLEHSRNATFVTSILHAVKRELDSEQKTFSDFHRYITEFKKLKDDLYPWLHQKPQLNELQESKKKVRGLKSQLRHKLADLQDIEENEGYNDHHVKMKKELEEVRANLHQAITEEDEHMAQIAREAEQHFPELMLQNSELGLNSYLSYNGMVKVGREPDHYSLDKQIAPGIYQ
ncbi:STK31 [Acanthosepion pharaonis]|uniref:STK31 n=1 Tax=Acanthosepion pharaonis TaxID=158019 RepID=A0A812DDM9_ACAPH|nr:STK31 [Sepia pharaonis]